MDYVAVFNAVEAVWWMVLAIIVAGGRIPVLVGHSIERIVLVIAFFLFGVSDVIEIQTGAWWRPMGLLVLKAMCIVSFIVCVVAIAIKRKAEVTDDGEL